MNDEIIKLKKKVSELEEKLKLYEQLLKNIIFNLKMSWFLIKT